MDFTTLHENITLESKDKQIKSIVKDFVVNTPAKRWIESLSSLTVKEFKDGLSNVLYALRSSKRDGVIVKIYGKNSDLIVNRDVEIRTMIYLVKYYLSPPIILTFNNGFIYQYAIGEPIKRGDRKRGSLIAKRLAEFHCVPFIDEKQDNQLAEKLRHYINLLNGKNNELSKRHIDVDSVNFIKEIDWFKLSNEIDQIEMILCSRNEIWSKMAIVLCHNDTQSLNFLLDENDENHVSIIDFEHAFRNLWLFDIFNHFVEYAGVSSEQPHFETDYPSRNDQKQWLEVYLSHATFLNDRFEQQLTLDQLCDFGDRLRAPIHLYWALWAFLQALINFDSMSKFDYVKYGRCRLHHYEKYKTEFLFKCQ